MTEDKSNNKDAKDKAPSPKKAAPAKDKAVPPKPAPAPKAAAPSDAQAEAIKPAPAPAPKPAAKKSVPLDDEDDEPFFPVDDDDDTLPLDASLVVADTSERTLLVVDEEGQRRNETVTIIQQILPNAAIEVADDPEEAMEMMLECDFDTYVVNFLMPGFSNSRFVKAVANHPDHPLLVGFAADKMSDALDPKKGLKIIPLKRLFDLSGSGAGEGEGEGGED